MSFTYSSGSVTLLNGGNPVASGNPLPVDVRLPGEVTLGLQPVISAGVAYAAGDALGGRMDFAGAARTAFGAAVITKIVIVDDAQQLAPIDIIFWNAAFVATVDNAPFDPTDADLQSCIGFVDVASTDYSDFNDNSVACKTSGLRMPFVWQDGGNLILYAQMVVRAAATYVTNNDLLIKITVRQL